MRFGLWLALASLTVAGCATQNDTPIPKNANPVVMNGQGEMAGEVTATSVILQSRLTSVDHLVDGRVIGRRRRFGAAFAKAIA